MLVYHAPTRQHRCGAAVTAIAVTLMLVTMGARDAKAQAGQDERLPDRTETMRLAGPRFGMTFLTAEMRDSLSSYGIEVGPMITQFGWQFEKQFLGQQTGIVAVSEWIALVGGLERGVFLPSLSWIIGVRSPGGTEFGVGPNVSAAGVGLVIAAGVTFRATNMNIPLSLAVVPTVAGARISILSGFTLTK